MRKSRNNRRRKFKRKIKTSIIGIILVCVIYVIISNIYNTSISKKNERDYEETKLDKNSDQSISFFPENTRKVIELKKSNNDVKGWIQIEGTKINYPILQSSDDEYYLTHNYKKKETKYGSIYIKSTSDLIDKKINTIIYGHNMKDGQMFSELLNYEDYEFYKAHQTVKISTERLNTYYEIIAVFKSKVYNKDEKDVFKYYNYTSFETEEQLKEYIGFCKDIDLYETGKTAEYGEKIITLSTCEYSQKNGRFVVVAKEKKEYF